MVTQDKVASALVQISLLRRWHSDHPAITLAQKGTNSPSELLAAISTLSRSRYRASQRCSFNTGSLISAASSSWRRDFGLCSNSLTYSLLLPHEPIPVVRIGWVFMTLPWDSVHVTGSTPYQWLMVSIPLCRTQLIGMQMGSRLSKQVDMTLELGMCSKEEWSMSSLIANMDRRSFEEEGSQNLQAWPCCCDVLARGERGGDTAR